MDQPPRITSDFTVTPFIDGLESIIPDKLTALFTKQDELLQQRKEYHVAIRNLQKRGELDSFGVYFWTQWAELNFSDYYTIQKWIQYWLLLLNKIPHEKIELPKKYQSRLDRELRIQQAKTVMLENFYQGQLRGGGTRLQGLCPFHEENKPSFFIYTDSNTFHCFGCGKNGDVIDFLMLTRDISFNEALELLT